MPKSACPALYFEIIGNPTKSNYIRCLNELSGSKGKGWTPPKYAGIRRPCTMHRNPTKSNEINAHPRYQLTEGDPGGGYGLCRKMTEYDEIHRPCILPRNPMKKIDFVCFNGLEEVQRERLDSAETCRNMPKSAGPALCVETLRNQTKSMQILGFS